MALHLLISNLLQCFACSSIGCVTVHFAVLDLNPGDTVLARDPIKDKVSVRFSSFLFCFYPIKIEAVGQNSAGRQALCPGVALPNVPAGPVYITTTWTTLITRTRYLARAVVMLDDISLLTLSRTRVTRSAIPLKLQIKLKDFEFVTWCSAIQHSACVM